MGMHKIAKMPSPEELKEEMPLSEEAKQIESSKEIKRSVMYLQVNLINS